MGLLAAIRLRGNVGVPADVRSTLRMLRLTRANHATLLEDDPALRGMLEKASGYLTYGELNLETLIVLLKERGRLRGDKPLIDDYAKKLKFNSMEELATALFEGKLKFKDLPNIKPVFRLHPPSGGFNKSIKKPYGSGGELGYRGRDINELLKKMI